MGDKIFLPLCKCSLQHCASRCNLWWYFWARTKKSDLPMYLLSFHLKPSKTWWTEHLNIDKVDFALKIKNWLFSGKSQWLSLLWAMSLWDTLLLQTCGYSLYIYNIIEQRLADLTCKIYFILKKWGLQISLVQRMLNLGI